MSDHSVQISKVLKVKRWQALRFITHTEEFPRFMPSVKEGTVLEKSAKGAVTCWSVEFDNIPFSWKQQEAFNLKKGEITFKAIEGDLEKFEGKWKLEKHPQGTQIHLEIHFSIGIPMIEKLIIGSLGELIKQNFKKMLDAIEERHVMEVYKNIRHRRFSRLRGFAVIGHPYNFQHLVRYFQHFKPDIQLPSREFVAKIFDLTHAY